MSKSILGIVIDVVAIGLMFIPGVGTALGIGMKIAGLGITVAQAVGAGLMIASSVLIGPAKPKPLSSNAPTERLYATLVPTAPRKWVFGGPTAMATDMRYQTFSGSNQEYYYSVIAVASHECQSIDEIWFDNEKAWNGSVQGRYVGYLTVMAAQTLGTSANGVAIDSTWTTSCTLTGCAYVILKYKMTGNSDNVQSPFQGGITNRITIRGKGAKVYDPRLDSTVSGGSGSHRAGTQSTWTWDANGSRNPALQLLWFLLGWKINGKLALGMGLPAARIDLPSFIAAANVCDESITLNGGGTEPRYRCDGVLAEDEDRQAVIESLCSQMNATLRDNGGKLSLTVLHNDLSSPVASFTEADILQGGKWAQTLALSNSFNIVRGRRIDPSDTSLYQPVDFPEVSLTSPDGIDRIDSVDYPFVQSNGQAQRLAKQRLQRNQYQGRYSFVGGERWWQVNVGDVIQLSHQSYGWSNKLFRVVEQAINPGTVDAPGGDVKITLLEENSAIYAWANNEAAAVTPGTPTIYDPLNSPLLLAINNATGALGDTNRVKFSLYEAGTIGWGVVSNASSLATTLSTGTSGGKNYLGLTGNFTAASQVISIGTSGLAQNSYLFPVNEGERLFVSALLGVTVPAGGSWQLTVGFLNAAGSTLTPDSVASASGNLTFPVYESNYITVPTGAVNAWVELQAFSNAATSGAFQLNLSEVLVTGAGAFQTAKPAFTPGPAADLTTVVNGPMKWTFNYDYQGTALTGEFNKDLVYKLSNLQGVVQSGVSWFFAVKTGTMNGLTVASGAQTMSGSGAGTLTVTSLATDVAEVEISATYQGINRGPIKIQLNRAYAAAPIVPSGSSGGALSSKSSGFTSINSTTFTDITGTLTGVMPAGVTTAKLNASLTFKPSLSGGLGSWTVELKWQRNISGTWTDQGTGVVSGNTDVFHDSDTGSNDCDVATITNNQSIGSLTAGTSYDWRCVARLTSGTRTHTITGNVSVTT